MNREDINIHKSRDFGFIRSVLLEGKVWFVGKDIGQSLGYKDYNQAIVKYVDMDDIKHFVMPGMNVLTGELSKREFKTVLINENGVYSLILSCRTNIGKKFELYLKKEILSEYYNIDDSKYMKDKKIEVKTCSFDELTFRNAEGDMMESVKEEINKVKVGLETDDELVAIDIAIVALNSLKVAKAKLREYEEATN